MRCSCSCSCLQHSTRRLLNTAQRLHSLQGEAIAFALGGSSRMLRAGSLAGLLNQQLKAAGGRSAEVSVCCWAALLRLQQQQPWVASMHMQVRKDMPSAATAAAFCRSCCTWSCCRRAAACALTWQLQRPAMLQEAQTLQPRQQAARSGCLSSACCVVTQPGRSYAAPAATSGQP